MSQTTEKSWNQRVWQQCGFDLMKAELLHEKRVISSQHDEPNHKKLLKPAYLAIVQLRPSESRALAWKESHLFPTWWAKPQKNAWNQRVWQQRGFDLMKAELLHEKRVISSRPDEPNHEKHLKQSSLPHFTSSKRSPSSSFADCFNCSEFRRPHGFEPPKSCTSEVAGNSGRGETHDGDHHPHAWSSPSSVSILQVALNLTL